MKGERNWRERGHVGESELSVQPPFSRELVGSLRGSNDHNAKLNVNLISFSYLFFLFN